MNKRNNNEDNDYESVEPFMLIAKPLGIEYTVNINEAFSHTKQFEYIVHALDNANEADQFTFNLATPGGSIQAVLPLLGSMNDTQAHVHIHACSDVASAGTLLLMKADSVSVNDDVEIMFHQVRFGVYGEGWNVERQVEHVLKSSKKLLRKYYKYFLTEAEISQMLTGTPFYMDKTEFIDRYQKRAELMNDEIDEAIAAHEAAQAAKVRKPRVKKATKPVDTTQPVT